MRRSGKDGKWRVGSNGGGLGKVGWDGKVRGVMGGMRRSGEVWVEMTKNR